MLNLRTDILYAILAIFMFCLTNSFIFFQNDLRLPRLLIIVYHCISNLVLFFLSDFKINDTSATSHQTEYQQIFYEFDHTNTSYLLCVA